MPNLRYPPVLPPPQALPRLNGSREQARSERPRDKWEAREGDDGNERRARAGSDPSYHSFHPRRSRATGNEVNISANVLLINVQLFSLLLTATPIAFSSY